jgi:predicted transcriptional regulator
MSVRLSESVWLELDALYKRTGVKKQTLIEHAITDMLANHRSKV